MPAGKNSPVRARTVENVARALELRRAGLGFEAIGAQLGLKKSQAHRLVVAGLSEARAQVAASADDLRSEELSRLDGMLTGLWPRARKGEVAAVDRVLKIAERRAKLLGLDAPQRQELTGKDGRPLIPDNPNDLTDEQLAAIAAGRSATAA